MLTAIYQFAIAAFLIGILPGQGMAMVLRQTLVGGRKIGLLSVLGNSTGLLIWGALSAAGLSAIFLSSEVAHLTLKFAGAVYLIYIGGKTLWHLRDDSKDFIGIDSGTAISPSAAFRTGLVTNLTNVKAAVFAVAFIPNFIPADFSISAGALILGVVWAIVSGSVYTSIIFAVHQVSHLLQSNRARRRIALASGIGVIFLGVTVALS